MISIADLLDRAKAGARIESDYRLAKVIGISHNVISGYRSAKSMPNAKILAQLCALSGDDVAVVAAQVEAARAQSPEGKTMWMMIAARLQGAATTAILSVCFAIALIAAPASDARASTVFAYKTGDANLLYIVSNTFLSVAQVVSYRLMVRLRRYAVFFRLCFAAWA